MSASNLHIAWARLFIESLRSAGVRDFVISPGSRSTPLVLAVAAAAREKRARVHVILDERAAAFFALGQARAQGTPSALLCTSGTAGAHYLPAIIEASQSHVPMIVVTADRPWEDYDAAAAQTIDQVKLFGAYVRHYAELGLPDAGALHAVVRIAAQAAYTSRCPRPGPVHVNARFRKPLEPIPGAPDGPWSARIERLIADGAPRCFAPRVLPDPAAVAELARLCTSHPRGIIACGPAFAETDLDALRRGVLALSAATGYPIFAEATSGLRFGGGAPVCGGFDALLRSPRFRERHRPELILELGAPLVSTVYTVYTSEHASCRRVVIAPHGWNDPTGRASQLVFCDPAELAAQLAAACPDTLAEREPRISWRASFAAADRAVFAAVQAQRDDVMSEGDVANAVVDALSPGATLIVGNSLPVRDLDTFCAATDKPLTVLHQRGASGIDGLISGAAGTRSVCESPVALLLGDLSALHDVGGWNALAAVRGPLCVVIVQNQGGRIFAQLPIGQDPSTQTDFEALFLTPQRADFTHAARLFDLPFVRVTNRAELTQALAQGLQSDRPLVIEAVVPAEDGTARRARLWKQIITQQSSAPAPPPATIHNADSTRLPTVYLHGFLGAPSAFAELAARRGGPYSAEYLPGHGPTPWVLPQADFDAVIDAMAAALPSARCELVGYSLGARLALALAIRHPARVARLTLIGVDPGLRSDDERASRIAWEDSLVRRLGSATLASFVDEWESLPIFATQRGLDPQRLQAQRASRTDHVASAIAWALRTLGTGRMPSAWSQLASLRMPVHLLTGALDSKFTAIGQQMTQVAPQLRHTALPNAGHNLLLEAPDAVFRALHDNDKVRLEHD